MKMVLGGALKLRSLFAKRYTQLESKRAPPAHARIPRPDENNLLRITDTRSYWGIDFGEKLTGIVKRFHVCVPAKEFRSDKNHRDSAPSVIFRTQAAPEFGLMVEKHFFVTDLQICQ
jgi:hypothetical protein